jgi:hypothetical protein
MNNIDSDPTITGTDREIASRFARMRASEAASAPAFTVQTIPAAERARADHPRTVARIVPRLAAAIAVVAVAVSLLYETPQEDPAALYASIMENQQVQTDSLLIVSDSVLPALRAVPRLFDTESAFAANTETD